MKAKDIMTTDVILIRHNDRLWEASDTMLKNNIGFLPVLKRNNIIGVITDRDIIIRGIANKARSSDKVSKYMTESVIKVHPEDSLETVYQQMKEHKITRILVMDQKEVEGVISLADLLRKTDYDKENLAILKSLKQN